MGVVGDGVHPALRSAGRFPPRRTRFTDFGFERERAVARGYGCCVIAGRVHIASGARAVQQLSRPRVWVVESSVGLQRHERVILLRVHRAVIRLLL